MLTHICLSDLHAGAPNSLLMDRPANTDANAVSTQFAAAMKSFLAAARKDKKQDAPQLLLLGDVLDLQFSDRTVAMENATAFLKGLYDTGQFAPSVIATAGNHDHALWSDARLGLEIDPNTPKDHSRATPAFAPTPKAQSRMLNAVVAKAGFGAVDFRYPNIGLANDDRTILLHHGHFAEAEYLTISRLINTLSDDPNRELTVTDVAAENAGWIDFLWPSVSETGYHSNLSDIFQLLLTPTGFRRISAQLADLLTKTLSDALPLGGNLQMREALHMAARMGLDVTVGKFLDSARYYDTAVLSPGGIEDLLWYLEGPVARQLIDERGKISDDVTVVFGHTHKPFADRFIVDGYNTPLKIFNTGGWTLNGPQLDNCEAAAMVLIDDALNVASVRIFGTPHDGKIPPPSVTILSKDCTGATAFKEDIEHWLKASRRDWAKLTDAALEAYLRMQAILLKLTEAEIAKQAQIEGQT